MPAYDSEHGLALVVVIAFLGNFLKEKPGRMLLFFTALKNDLFFLHFLWCEQLIMSCPQLAVGIH